MEKDPLLDSNIYYVKLLKGLITAKRKGSHLKVFSTKELNEIEKELLIGADYLVKEWRKDVPSNKTLAKICRYLDTPFGFSNWDDFITKENTLLEKENKAHIINELVNYSEQEYNLFLNERIVFWVTNFDEVSTFNLRLKQDLLAFRQFADKKKLSAEDRQVQVQKLVEQKSMAYFGTPIPPVCDVTNFHEIGAELQCNICDDIVKITRRGECPFCGINFIIWKDDY